MISPAQRHMMRASAISTAQQVNEPLRHATPYEQMLVKLAADKRTLKGIFSHERKADKKRELLPFYAPWVAGVLAEGKGRQDDIIMTVMLWRLDANDIAGALEIAPYVLRFGLSMPDRHTRTAPYLLAEEVALAAQRVRASGQSVDIGLLENTLELTSTADMPDQVRARLHKVTGLLMSDANQLSDALQHLQRAMQLDPASGVKKEIERLTRSLRPAPAPPSKQPARRNSKVKKRTG